MLEDIGFDALPYWREAPAADPQYPLTLFMGVRENEYFQTGHRHIAALRKRNPEPRFFISPADSVALALEEGAYALLETQQGALRMKVAVRDDMPAGVVRGPHGWWQPERP